MDNDKLQEIISTLSDKIEGQKGNWRFTIKSTMLICLTDQFHNRMRIISPIDKLENITNEQIIQCMKANFHTSLDARYSISDGILWSAFIHPLKELTNEQVKSAISQVYSCAGTFGTHYSGGTLIFPTDEERKSKEN